MTRFLTMPILYGLLAVLIALGVFATVQTLRLAGERTAHANTRADTAATLRNLADLSREAADNARAVERTYHADLAEGRIITREEFINALDVQGRVVADLRAGRDRVQKQWRGCLAALSVPGDAEAGPGADEGTGVREQGAGDLVGAIGQSVGHGAQADAWIRGLQRELTSAHKLCGPDAKP